ncbi:pilus assembly protein TadG-related protein [Streptomyces chattanoogensis]|uniref:pilus assembly protein TadG-related protein n=1 Tax=Streptomyces chattanoogensis TaxID=66876 RepID=UPI00367A5EB1
MRQGVRQDAGQAFPLYIVAVAGLLFLAFAFFAVGQAAATRNSAQTAADAAALGAAQTYRDDLYRALRKAVEGDDETWEDLLKAMGSPTGTACDSAQWFAGKNDADATSCTPDSWPTSFAVRVTTRGTVGDSIVPGTENKHASAGAKAVIVPRCTVRPAESGGRPGDGGPAGRKESGKGKGKGLDKGKAPGNGKIELTCDGKRLTLDPEHLDPFPEPADFFAVRLAE